MIWYFGILLIILHFLALILWLLSIVLTISFFCNCIVTPLSAGGSSNEDLSDSTEVSIQKSRVKKKLKKFFAKRPAMEVLVKKGIYKGSAIILIGVRLF